MLSGSRLPSTSRTRRSCMWIVLFATTPSQTEWRSAKTQSTTAAAAGALLREEAAHKHLKGQPVGKHKKITAPGTQSLEAWMAVKKSARGESQPTIGLLMSEQATSMPTEAHLNLSTGEMLGLPDCEHLATQPCLSKASRLENLGDPGQGNRVQHTIHGVSHVNQPSLEVMFGNMGPEMRHQNGQPGLLLSNPEQKVTVP